MPLEVRAPIRGSRQVGVRLPAAVPHRDPLGVERFRRLRPAAPPVVVRPRVMRGRLRHTLLAAAIGSVLAALAPRALAYFRLYETATEFANYAVCMAGPTGPATLGERPSEFWRLVRRRLVASPADSRPFASCAPLLAAFADGAARRRSHEAHAHEFREYAGAAPDPTRWSLADLRVTAGDLERLERASWPFVPPKQDEIVRPSRNARAAAHPSDPPVPARGRGLPAVELGPGTVSRLPDGYLLVAGRDANLVAYSSRDGGVSWSPLDRRNAAVQAHAGRCSGGDSGATFRFDSVGEQLRVESWRGAELETSFPVAALESRLSGVSCDGSAVLALIAEREGRAPALRLCRHAARCRDLALPREIERMAQAQARWSVARARGASVVSIATGGIVRVISSRDDGETWTPAVVAFDGEESASWGKTSRVPSRLLALDDRVLLYAGANDGQGSYPVLASDDFGASWRALESAR